ncbi:glycosyltransferase family 2 protein [Microbacterium sp. STN6]|uniref:glycosyltransferase family 2 protein n=1 Tax=Microbacterium sp. STN6 TaxID=2995588 RepID=UPI003A598BA9
MKGDHHHMASTTAEYLVVAITTYRRPELLGPLLDLVADNIRNETSLATSILVVDNDPDESARRVAEARRGVHYVTERVPGIAAARQRALDEAPKNSVLIYLDDDVVPTSTWIRPLLEVWQDSGAAIVAGFVRYTFPQGTDPWIVHGGFIRRESRPTGSRLSAAAAGNILVDVAAVRRFGVRFDASLGLSGGEDTLFTSQVTRAGGAIVWCQESIVDDAIPEARATRSFCVARAQAHGSAEVLVQLRLASSPLRRAAARARCGLGGVARVIWGYTRHLIGRLSANVYKDADGIRVAARGWGMARGAMGLTTAEYGRHPSARSKKA